jgi:hypothetical protein
MQEETGITPKALVDRPALDQRWHYAKSVFDDLAGSRNYTAGGPANIPYTVYSMYANDRGFSQSDLIDVWEDLSLIDSIWLAQVIEKQNAQRKST